MHDHTNPSRVGQSRGAGRMSTGHMAGETVSHQLLTPGNRRWRAVKVLAVIDSFSFGGAERVLATLAKAQAPAGLELEVASLAPYSADRAGMLPVLRDSGLPLS